MATDHAWDLETATLRALTTTPCGAGPETTRLLPRLSRGNWWARPPVERLPAGRPATAQSLRRLLGLASVPGLRARALPVEPSRSAVPSPCQPLPSRCLVPPTQVQVLPPAPPGAESRQHRPSRPPTL